MSWRCVVRLFALVLVRWVAELLLCRPKLVPASEMTISFCFAVLALRRCRERMRAQLELYGLYKSM